MAAGSIDDAIAFMKPVTRTKHTQLNTQIGDATDCTKQLSILPRHILTSIQKKHLQRQGHQATFFLGATLGPFAKEGSFKGDSEAWSKE